MWLCIWKHRNLFLGIFNKNTNWMRYHFGKPSSFTFTISCSHDNFLHKAINPSFCGIGTCICHIILVKIMGVYDSSLCTYPLTCVSLTEAFLFYSFINLNINIHTSFFGYLNMLLVFWFIYFCICRFILLTFTQLDFCITHCLVFYLVVFLWPHLPGT